MNLIMLIHHIKMMVEIKLIINFLLCYFCYNCLSFHMHSIKYMNHLTSHRKLYHSDKYFISIHMCPMRDIWKEHYKRRFLWYSNFLIDRIGPVIRFLSCKGCSYLDLFGRMPEVMNSSWNLTIQLLIGDCTILFTLMKM